ncbi:MAG: hypothetical protein EBR38_07385 [Flavobacteriaceae bacterium]|jgi:protein CpxP|nr:hypothetical protein [Flavobacteriaceae bacterium]
MKKLIVATMLVVGISTFAQVEKKENDAEELIEKVSPEKKVEMVLKRMTKQLKLNEAQQKEMKVIITEQEAKRAEGNFNPSKEDRMAMNEKITKILNPDQKATWDKIQEERKEKMREKMREKMKEKKKKKENKAEKTED